MDTKETDETESTDEATPVFERRGHLPQRGFLHNEIVKTGKMTRDFLLDHPKTKFSLEQVFIFAIEALSAFLFAYGFRAFMSPSRVPYDFLSQTVQSSISRESYNALSLVEAVVHQQPNRLVSGGASGIAQVLTRICELVGLDQLPEKTLQSLFYFLINVPIMVLSFMRIGKRFTIYTLLNVGMTSLFIEFIPQDWCELIAVYDDNVARALAGGITTGISSGIALAIGTSTGGVDVLSLYVAEKKSTTVGKYSMFINVITVLTYTLLCFLKAPSDSAQMTSYERGAQQATMALYTIIYFYLSAKLVDLLNIKNKKTELQIITAKPEMAQVLIHGFPHACTIIDAKGGFTGTPLKVIYIVVSKSEVKKVVDVIRQVDTHSFVSVLTMDQVYGKFYIKPIE